MMSRIVVFFRFFLILFAVIVLFGSYLHKVEATDGTVQNVAMSTKRSTFEELQRPSSGRNSAEEVIRKIPWQLLTESEQQRAAEIVANHTLYRRLPVAGGFCNPELFDFILCHPEIIIGFWEALGYCEMSLERVNDKKYILREKTGTVGNIDVLVHEDEIMVLWCDGSYRGPVSVNEIVGEMLIVIQTRYTTDMQGNPMTISRLDSFARVRNVGVEIMAKVFGPLLFKIAESNFDQTVAFVSSLSKGAEEGHDRLEGITRRAPNISPTTKNDFLRICNRVTDQTTARRRGEPVEYRLLPKGDATQGNLARIIADPPSNQYNVADAPAHR